MKREMHVPMESDVLPEHYDEASRHLGIRLVVAGVTLALRRADGQWPTACEVLAALDRVGLATEPPDDDIDATPEAVLWFNLAQQENADGTTDPWSVALWDEGAPGLVRVVVPAKVVADLETYAELKGYGAL